MRALTLIAALALALIPRPQAHAGPDVLEVMVGYTPLMGYHVGGEYSPKMRHGAGDLDVGYFTRLGDFELGGHVTALVPPPDSWHWGLAFMPTVRYVAGSNDVALILGLGVGYQHIWNISPYSDFDAHLLRVELEVGGRFHVGGDTYFRFSLRPWYAIGGVGSVDPGELYHDAGAMGGGLPDIMFGFDFAL